ncbi:hypothetical protein ATSB10_01770 [Dyella thiooxydans]|uniref:DUF1579 domain-containing protein n=1 Tax=Dyella thiooxydans TaxID=445710 RepID=A0A160MWS2_9GAMM|nr:DUF1579 family protein [Dyella thiooxydans]AND67631.1 hypothetical protein ATSB10_01770 [Dyella thiooxydans]
MTDAWQRMAGRWEGEERISATRWGPAGLARGFIEARIELGGRVLVQDYRQQRDGHPALQVHAVFATGADHRVALYWFDSYGFVPQEPAGGAWQDGMLVIVRRSPRGETRHRYTLQDAKCFRLELASSFDQGANWEPVMEATYHRIGD